MFQPAFLYSENSTPVIFPAVTPARYLYSYQCEYFQCRTFSLYLPRISPRCPICCRSCITGNGLVLNHGTHLSPSEDVTDGSAANVSSKRHGETVGQAADALAAVAAADPLDDDGHAVGGEAEHDSDSQLRHQCVRGRAEHL